MCRAARYSAVRLETPEDAVAKLACCAANPVSAGLVEDPRRWPGAKSTPADYGREIVVARPRRFSLDDGGAPETYLSRA